MVLPFSLFCFRFKNERRIFFSCPQTFLHFVPTLQCQICGFVFSTTAPSAIWTIWRIKLHTCVKAARYFQLWHAIINRIGNIGPVVNTHARYNFLYSHIYLHLAAPVKRCCPFYCIFSKTFSISKTLPYSPYCLLQNFFIGLSILLCRSFRRSQYCGRYR